MASARRKSAAIALAVIGIAGLSLASAAQLNVSTGSLGASSEIVESCQPASGPAIGLGFTNVYAATGYATSGVSLNDVAAACTGLAVRITVADAAGASLGEVVGIAATGDTSYALPANVDATLIESVSVVISG